MSTILEDLSVRIGNFPKELEDFSRSILNSPKVKEWLVIHNIYNLEEGKRPDGTDIEKDPTGNDKSTGYERYTKYLKEKYNKISDRVTLYDTGDFYKGIKVVSGSDNLYLIGQDPKTDQLIARWGMVLGINEMDKIEFIEFLYPMFLDFSKKYFKI